MEILFLAGLLLFLGGVVLAFRLVLSAPNLSWQRRLYALVMVGWLFVFVFGMAGWLIGSAFTTNYGGRTDEGKIEEGRYFVASHGHFREVTAAEWKFLQRMESIFGHQWLAAGAVGFFSFLGMGLMGQRIFVPAVVRIPRLKNMKWVARSSDPPTWWFCDDDLKDPFVVIVQHEDLMWYWTRHSMLESDGIGPAQGAEWSLPNAQVASLNGILAANRI